MDIPPQVQLLIDRDAIRRVMFRYCRAIDRLDEPLLRSVYWEEAVDNHGMYNGPVDGFVRWVVPRLAAMQNTSHFLGNMRIEVDGVRAKGETYFQAYHRRKMDGKEGWHDVWVSGRYLDEFEKRGLDKDGGEWRIINRLVIADWTRDYGPSEIEELRTRMGVIGAHGAEDPSHGFFGPDG